MIKVNSVCEDDLNAKVKSAFEDYFLILFGLKTL